MALLCGHRELRQRHEGFLKSSCFSGSRRQNMRRTVGAYTGENAPLGVMVVGHVLHSNHKASTALSLFSFPLVFRFD
ncbi:hypothetical protein DY000_02058797 [Brassica cretica]|nr:hypothetical protein DY000_02058797 [Brassica cretica]